MRITWEDGTPVEAYFIKKSESKSQVTIQHPKLPSKQEAERMKKFWAERLARLAEFLE